LQCFILKQIEKLLVVRKFPSPDNFPAGEGKTMRDAVIVAGARTAVGKSHKGVTRQYRADEMAATVIRHLLDQHKDNLDPAQVDDVVLGCAYPEASQGFNMARIVALRSGLPSSVAGMTLNRLCSSGLQAIALSAQRIMTGESDIIVAGGAESMSLIKRGGFNWEPNPAVQESYPGVYITMGLTAENVAQEYGVTREEMDEYACQSHMKAARAVDAGYFHQEIVPLDIDLEIEAEDGTTRTEQHRFSSDEHLRRDTTLEALARLKPAFKEGGLVTAGNSSPLSDGAAAVIVMEAETAARLGLQPLLRFVGFATGGVRPDIMGIGPVEAVPKVLERNGLRMDDIDLIELNEAFAAQVIPVMRELEMDPSKVNVNGGAIALGHPLGCTGAKLTVQMMNQMQRTGGRYGLVTMCVGGGMGAAGIFENLN
jgi:acetyl-CoA acyltransferase